MFESRISRRSVLKIGCGLLATTSLIRSAKPAFAALRDDGARSLSDEGDDHRGGFAGADTSSYGRAIYTTDPIIESARRPFGRAIQSGLAIREAPGIGAKLVRWLSWNEVIDIKGQTMSEESPTAYNQIWYQTSEGYVYSAFIQPVDQLSNTPLDSVDDKGFWAEVTMPFTAARSGPAKTFYAAYTFYFGCVFRIVAIKKDKDGGYWYKCDNATGNGLWVLATDLRPIPIDEFQPISPDVPAKDKRIDVDISKQITTAYENDKPVFTARVATGARFTLSDGTVKNFRTIPGEHRIFLKSASQHMIGGTIGESDYYDLPGIGWCSYFTASGIAFHATYWHNDFGLPRSHGCVNMLPEDAKWVFRWTLPAVSYDLLESHSKKASDGTLIKVF